MYRLSVQDMEKSIKIPTKDDHYIYGTLNYTSSNTKNVIVIVHGLSGHQEEHPYYAGARYFIKHNFAVCRFDLYSWKKKARKLDETTIAINAEDTNTIVNHLRKEGYKKVFVVGHSLGALSLLLSNTQRIDGLVLWDPSNDQSLRKKRKWIKYDKRIDNYLFYAGIKFLMGKKMHREWKNFPNIAKKIKQIQKPLLIIAAGKGKLEKRSQQYYKNANQPKKLVIIKEAGHTFSEEGTEEQLFRETLSWCKKFS